MIFCILSIHVCILYFHFLFWNVVLCIFELGGELNRGGSEFYISLKSSHPATGLTALFKQLMYDVQISKNNLSAKVTLL